MKNRRDHTAPQQGKRIALGLGVGVLTLLSMTGLSAMLMDREVIGVEWMNYLAALVLAVSSLIGGLTGIEGQRRWLGPLAVGGGLWLFLLTVNALGYGGDLSGAGATALAILGGSGASILLGRGGNTGRKRRRKYPNR